MNGSRFFQKLLACYTQHASLYVEGGSATKYLLLYHSASMREMRMYKIFCLISWREETTGRPTSRR